MNIGSVTALLPKHPSAHPVQDTAAKLHAPSGDDRSGGAHANVGKAAAAQTASFVVNLLA